MISHYRWFNERMEIFSRDDANELIVAIDGVSMEMSHQISTALDRVHKDGLKAGRIEVINAVNRATDTIAV